MPAHLDANIRKVVEAVNARLREQGAKAVVLVGSHARGDARPDSDIDLFAVGEGPAESFSIVDGHRVAVHWWQPDEARERIFTPETAPLAVRAWRDGVVIDDPDGLAAQLKRHAEEWTWDTIGSEADAWVAEKLVGWAEYVLKLGSAVGAGRDLDARAFAAELALGVSDLAAVQNRLLEPSENGLREAIADAGGDRWRDAQEQAFAVNREGVREAAAGAIALYELAAADADNLFDDEQRRLVRSAIETARGAAA